MHAAFNYGYRDSANEIQFFLIFINWIVFLDTVYLTEP